MKRNTLLNVLGWLLSLLSLTALILAVHMETGKQFWIMTFISIGYLVCGGFAFSGITTEEGV